jgi:hypothetical protein
MRINRLKNGWKTVLWLVLAGTLVMLQGAESFPRSCDPNYILYLSPAGNDTAAGTPEAPIHTFQRAGEILAADKPDCDVVIRLRSDEGIYVDYSVVWTYYNPRHSTTFEPYPLNDPAVFRGDGPDPPTDPFFTLDAAKGEPTNLVFKGLRVEGYAARVFYFVGDEENPVHGWNGHNRITDCAFKNIGNYWQPEAPIVYGAITFVNSTDNVIEDCTFSDFANANSYAGAKDAREFPEMLLDRRPMPGEPEVAASSSLPIIGVYLAHNSSRDSIIRCSMDSIFGDPVRIRDASDGTLIDRCTFTCAGHNGVCSTWFCDATLFDCDKVHPECPSCYAVIRDSEARGDRHCAVPRMFVDLNQTYSRRCPTGCTLQARMRLENSTAQPCPH